MAVATTPFDKAVSVLELRRWSCESADALTVYVFPNDEVGNFFTMYVYPLIDFL